MVLRPDTLNSFVRDSRSENNSAGGRLDTFFAPLLGKVVVHAPGGSEHRMNGPLAVNQTASSVILLRGGIRALHRPEAGIECGPPQNDLFPDVLTTATSPDEHEAGITGLSS